MSNKGAIRTRIVDGVTEFTLVSDRPKRSRHVGARDKEGFARGVRVSESAKASRARDAHTAKSGGRNQQFVHNFTKLISFEVPE